MAAIVDPLYWLDQIQLGDRGLVGDKAYYLSRLVQRGYPAIPGFVIPGTVLRKFLETINWLEPLLSDLPNSSLHINIEQPRQLQSIAQQIRQAIQSTPFWDDWMAEVLEAARSFQSSTLILRPSLSIQSGLGRSAASPPLQLHGLLESKICPVEVDAIAHELRQLWAELFRARSLFYWQRTGIQLQQIHLAVLVQPLQPAVSSGELLMGELDLDVWATWGLGIAQSRGEVAPDRFHLHLDTGYKTAQHLGTKTLAYRLKDSSGYKENLPDPEPTSVGLETLPYLETWLLSDAEQNQYAVTDEQLQELTHLSRRLIADFGNPLALEWVFCLDHAQEKLELYVTQLDLHPLVRDVPRHRQGKLQAPPLESPAQRQVASGLAASPGRTIAQAQVITSHTHEIATVVPGSILVVPTISPNWLPWLKQTTGIIAEHGGMTSHGAIIARELGIPAVVGVSRATQLIQTGERLLLDGDRGIVYTVEAQTPLSNMPPAIRRTSAPSSPAPTIAETPLPLRKLVIGTQLMVNLSQPESIPQVKGLPVDGVGLLRSELMALTLLHRYPDLWRHSHLQAEFVGQLADQISKFAGDFAPRPVYYRSLDLRSHEFQSLPQQKGVTPELNPVLGIRGTFSYQQDPRLFELELAALAQVHHRGYTNIHLMLPFVRTVEEFLFCRERIERAGLRQNPNFQIWIMAEVPSILFLLPDYVQAGVQGISIGTNDLTQLMLGVDRDLPQLASTFDERHPSVQRAIAHLIQTAHSSGIPCSICGQAPVNHPDLIDQLVRWGITSISVDPSAVEATWRSISRAEQRLLLEAARQQE